MKSKILINISIFSFLIFFSIGCGVNYQFKNAEKLLENGRFVDAISKYQFIIEKYPDNSRLPEVIFIIGRIYQQNIEDNSEAKQYYKRVMNDFPDTEWAKDAKKAWLEIADYFPLAKSLKLIEADSDTSGKYMTAKNEIISSKDGIYEMDRTLYTRGRFVEGFTKYFKKTKDGVYETDKKGNLISSVFLYPLEVNKEWTVGNIRYTIISKNENVEIIAGKFTDCLKIKKQFMKTPSWSYEYYAPEVGKILTTQSSGYSEKRVTELKEYNIPAENN